MTHAAASQRWDRVKYDIALDFNTHRGPKVGTATVDGIRHHEVPLGIHMAAHHSLDVTHIPSGKRIASFKDLGAALEFVERVAYLTVSWAIKDPIIPSDIQMVILNIVREVSA